METENLEGWENWRFGFEVQNWTFEGCFEVEMTFKHILGVSATIPAQFAYKIILKLMQICPN